MSDDNVLDFSQKLDDLFKGMGSPPADETPPSPGPRKPEPLPGDDEGALPFDKLSHFPAAGDPYGKAHATPIKGSLPMVVLLLKDGCRPTFSYSDLRFMDVLPPKRPGDGPGLLLRFMGVGTVELEGIGIDRLHGYLYLHRLAWIREWPGGRMAADDNAVLITRITVTLLEGESGK